MTKPIMMALGNYRFSVTTAAYQALKRSTPYRWSEQSRAGRRPAMQFLGIGKETVELSGTIYPLFNGGENVIESDMDKKRYNVTLGGLKQIDAMRAEAGQGKPLMLTDGTGAVWSRWCIESIEEDQTVFLPGGIPKKQTFRLSLSFYGDDA